MTNLPDSLPVLSVPYTQQSSADSVSIHPNLHSEHATFPAVGQNTVQPVGKTGIPIPYQLRMDDGITGVMLLCFFMLSYVFSSGKHFLYQQLKDFFLVRERNNLFMEEANVNFVYRLLLVLNTCLTIGLLASDFLSNSYGNTIHTHPFMWLCIYTGVALLYYAFKYLSYSFINWIFFDKIKRNIWIESFFLVFVTEGILLFILLLFVVYFELSSTYKFFFTTLILLIGKVMLVCKCAQIFFGKIHRSFYLILYLCALEVMPLFLLGRTLVLMVVCDNKILGL